MAPGHVGEEAGAAEGRGAACTRALAVPGLEALGVLEKRVWGRQAGLGLEVCPPKGWREPGMCRAAQG